MNDPVTRFLELFGVLAGDAAQAWCGDREAIGKFFKGTDGGPGAAELVDENAESGRPHISADAD